MRLQSLVVAALAVTLLGAEARAADVIVIVNAQNPGAQVKRESLLAIYMQPGARWADGKAAKPVDQSTRSPIRAAFSEQVLKMNLLAVQRHWMSALSSGATPPPVKTNDKEVIAFVRSDPAAIGYVSAEAALDPGVKVLKIVE